MGERAHFPLPHLSVPVISMRFMKHNMVGVPKWMNEADLDKICVI